MKKYLFIVCFLSFSCTAWAQTDSTTTTASVKKKLGKPTKAALLSAVLPGAGQYYNKTGWQVKVPVIYGGAVVWGYLILTNNSEYKQFRDAFIERNDENPLTTQDPFFENYTDDGLLRNRDKRKRDRDFYMIMGGAWYLLNVAEAATTAHLNEFDIKDDIGLKIVPQYENTFNRQTIAGVSFRFVFK